VKKQMNGPRTSGWVSIKKNDSWFVLSPTIMKTLEYPIVASCLMQKQWRNVMKLVLEKGLNAMQL
jgi:hypothetical protein